MGWEVTVTVLCSAFGFTLLSVFLYGVCYVVIPHLRKPDQVPDYTLPQVERPVTQQLRESLYSRPSLNYIDPRNSLAGTELGSSRWSTSIREIDPSPVTPISPIALQNSPALPRSPCMHFSRRQSFQSPNRPQRRAASSQRTRSNSSYRDRALRECQSANTLGHKRHSKSYPPQHPQLTALPARPGEQFRRFRSRSDSRIPKYSGILAKSHVALYTRSIEDVLKSPTESDLTGSTLMWGIGTPRRASVQSVASTSHVRSPLRYQPARTKSYEMRSPGRPGYRPAWNGQPVRRSRSQGLPPKRKLSFQGGQLQTGLTQGILNDTII